MKAAPLQLVDYFLTAFSVEANPDFNPSAPVPLDLDSLSVEPEVRLEEELGENGTKWFISLQISQDLPKGKNLPYRFRLHIQGIVLAAPQLKEVPLQRAVRANGPALLFGAAREIIRAGTGRGPWPAVIIPSTNFLDGLPPTPAPTKLPKKKAAAKKAR